MQRFSFYFFLLLFFIFIVYSQNLSRVKIGFDSSVGNIVIDNINELFNQLPTSIPSLLDMSNITAVTEALSNTDVLFLCPSNSHFDISPEMSGLINTFVTQGGILLYTAGFNDTRSDDVSIWLNNSTFFVNSEKSDTDINQFYITARPQYYYSQFKGIATNESLFTSFGRLERDRWGLPFKKFSDNIYWVENSTNHMALTVENEQFCMFKRSGFYASYKLFEACWVFDFPHGNGHAVEIAIDFADQNLFFHEFIDDFVGVVEAAINIPFESSLFPDKGQNVVFKLPTTVDSAWNNILYDLATSSNVYLWDTTVFYKYYRDLDNLLYFTNPIAFVTDDFYYGGFNKKQASPKAFFPGSLSQVYSNFMQNGGNIVSIGRQNQATFFLNNYLDLPGYVYNSFNARAYTYPQNILNDTEAQAFSNIPDLPSRFSQFMIGGLNQYCRFYTFEGEPYCGLWSAPIYSGHFTMLSWDFDSRYYYDPFFYTETPTRPESSWPNANWRTALTASLKPDDPPIDNTPIFDTSYLETIIPLNVILLTAPPFETDTYALGNIYSFLNMSNHNIFLWNDINNATELNEIINTGPTKDALVFPEIFLSQGFTRDALPRDLQSAVEDEIRQFVVNEGNLVFLGSGGKNYLQDIFNIYLDYGNQDRQANQFTVPLGYNLRSKYTSESIFAPYYIQGEILPFFDYEIIPDLIYDEADETRYCTYILNINYNNDYCGIWSKKYNSGGDISLFANSFTNSESYTGFRGSYVQNQPWVRALNIAMGGRLPPSTPPIPPTPSTTPTYTITNTASATPQTLSPTITATISFTRTISKSNTQSITISKSPSQTKSPTPSLSPGASASNTETATVSPTPTPTLSISALETPTPSKTPPELLIPVNPSVSPSTGASKSPIYTASNTPSKSLVSSTPSSSKSPLPSVGTDCNDCEVGGEDIFINPNSNSEVISQNLNSNTGLLIGTIFFPPSFAGDTETNLDITFIYGVPPGSGIGNTIFDITLTDEFGRQITTLEEPLGICLYQYTNEPTDDPCLSFYNTETGEWECEDECLEINGNEYCGTTNHLTSFSLLLDGGQGGGGGDPCDSTDNDYLYVWISLGFVAYAICCIICAVILIEVHFQRKKYVRHKSFDNISGQVKEHM